MATISGSFSFNGVILPMPPYVYNYNSYMFLVRLDGELYMFTSEYIGGYGLNAWYTEGSMLACWSKISRKWKYEGGAWVAQDKTAYNEESNYNKELGGYQICPKEALVWSLTDVGNQVDFWVAMPECDGEYMLGSEPVLISKANFILEPLPNTWLVASRGDTNITIGAQIRNKASDEVIDISDKAQYEVDAIAASYGCGINESRQLIVDSSFPNDSFSIKVTWSELSGQIQTIDVVIASDNGGDSGGSSTITDIAASETVLELTPGASYPLIVAVGGTEDHDPTVLYHVIGNVDGTYWDGSTIHVGEDATFSDYCIVFYSQQDPSYNLAVSLTVKELKPCYLKENGEWVKKTAYERIDSKWVKISDASRPPDYVFVEYLQSDGHSYFSTDIVPNAETEVEMQYSVQELLNLGTHMLSCENWYCPFPRKSIFLASRNGNELEITPAPVVNTIYTVRTYLDGTISINGADYGPLTAGTKNPTKPLYMCTYGGNPGSSNYAGECRVYYCKIWQAGLLVRDYIPAVNKSGVAGMYDKVTKTFYTSISEDFEAPT